MADTLHLERPYRDTLRACELDTVPKILAHCTGEVAAWSRTTDTTRVPGPGGVPGFYLKRYRYPTWNKRIRGMFRGTFFHKHRGQEEYALLSSMRRLGIPAVRPVAYGARRVGHFVSACFLITEEVPGACNLTSYAGDVLAGRATVDAAMRRAMCDELAERMAAMHEAGFAHGQLFWRNVLVRVACTGAPEFFFLDARPGRGRRWLARRSERYLNELAHTAASALPFTTRSERTRFVNRYLRVRQLHLEKREVHRYLLRLAERYGGHELQRIRMAERFETWNRHLSLEQQALDTGG